MNVLNQQQNNLNINNDIINNNNNYNIIQNGLIHLNDFPIVLVQGEYFNAHQLLQELENWIDRIKIRTYLNTMIVKDLLALDLDAGVYVHQDNIDNINNNFMNAENIIFTDKQNEYIDKVSKFIELCDMDEMRDFITYMNHRFN
jgi:hypothetical protein